MRFLYDSNYINSNCTIGYDESYNADNTAATYLTNYAVGVIGVIAAAAVLFQFSKHTIISDGIPMALFFGIIGFAFALAGIGHQIVKNRSDMSTGEAILVRLTYAMSLIANAILQSSFVTLATKNITLVMRVIWIIVNLAVLVHSMIRIDPTYMGVLSVITYLGGSVVYIVIYIRKRNDNGERCITYVTKAVSLVVMTVGYIVQAALAGICGDKAYETCFQNCPLPYEFNHNALFHVVFAIGLGLFAVAQLQQPEG